MNDNDFNIVDSLERVVERIIEFIPEVLAAIAVLIIGWIIAKIAQRLVMLVLRKLRFERSITLSPAGNYVTRIIEHPTAFIGKIVYWVVFLLFLSVALSALGVPALTFAINGVYSYIPNIIAAVIIFLVASAITAGAEMFVMRVLPPGALSKLLSAVIPAIIMPIAIFMILNQLHIAEDIVNITYTALVGSVSLGLALAFGLGGRDVAARILDQAYNNAQENKEEIRQEMLEARRNTRSQMQRARQKIDGQMQGNKS